MDEITLVIPDGYDRATQSTVGTLAAALDDQLRRIREEVRGLDVTQLEWQAQPGRNTVGILLAHLALVEIYWIAIAAEGRSWKEDGVVECRELLGIEDDGIPLAPDGGHHHELAGFPLERYETMLATARRVVHERLRTWTDASLDDVYTLTSSRGSRSFSRRWTLYHVLEHFAAHFGQVSLLKHEMRDAGILEEA